MITFVIEQEELYESRGSRTVLWEGLSEILEPDPIGCKRSEGNRNLDNHDQKTGDSTT